MIPSTSGERRRHLRSLPPTENVTLGGNTGLSLTPRLKLLLTFYRSDAAVKPIDAYSLTKSLLNFLHSSPPPLSLVSEDDLAVHRRPDLHKRSRHDPVATGTLYVRDLGFLKNQDNDSYEGITERFYEWRSSVVERLSGIELNLEGVKFKMMVEVPEGDDFEKVKKLWEDFYASQMLDSRRNSVVRRPDTIIVRGVPSRWFAETRVSSKASALVSHTIFSVFGEIRKINVAGDDDPCDKTGEGKGEIISGLNCKVWVQFENYEDFCNAMKVFCGRSMQKQGSCLKVDYKVTWDRDGFFAQQLSARGHGQEITNSAQRVPGYKRNESILNQSNIPRLDSDGTRHKRFRD